MNWKSPAVCVGAIFLVAVVAYVARLSEPERGIAQGYVSDTTLHLTTVSCAAGGKTWKPRKNGFCYMSDKPK